jgi:glycosyltransferase involved in cell wall biosynthesis
MSSPLVSVVIPTYNYGRFVCQAVDSALAQTYSPLEVIVVDDGSTDDTRQRLQSFGQEIRYVYQQNKHLSAARNNGIREARGVFIALLDSDDIWAPEKLARQVELFDRFPDIGLVGTESFSIDDQGSRVKPDNEDPCVGQFVEVALGDLLEAGMFGPSSVVIRNECLDVVGLFDETLRSVEDLDMWLRVAARYGVLKLLEPLTGLRVHNESMSTKAEPMLHNHQKVLTKSFSSIPELQAHRVWWRKGEARMFRSVAWMRNNGGDYRGAARDIVHSITCWPFALRDAQGYKKRLERGRMLVNYCLRAAKNRQ